ncbi:MULTISPECIES: cation transporter [unclassified Massilia]|uniref:cation transporter n=1 Tax=unclassified Massilia TaxID=2609279 RepID=UPI001B835D3A|nr:MULTISPECIES: cation transporter [unclassified Massilia]MBQ5938447.1 cation transporter [Massilia sp. AB1]MBQ5963245.1 cation transporter [Massilia sp. ZL223]
MSACCSGGCSTGKPPVDPRYRRILWIALWVNALMFVVELAGGWRAGSVSLLADAVDFLGDAANYGISLFVLALAPVWRSRTALLKGATMGLYGLFVLATTFWHLRSGTVPQAQTMGAIGVAALAANCLVGALLFAYRNGDANMRSVWLCTRNDAIGNLAVLLAAVGVWKAGSGVPDLLVATVMGLLGLSAARTVIGQALGELRAGASVVALRRR